MSYRLIPILPSDLARLYMQGHVETVKAECSKYDTLADKVYAWLMRFFPSHAARFKADTEKPFTKSYVPFRAYPFGAISTGSIGTFSVCFN